MKIDKISGAQLDYTESIQGPHLAKLIFFSGLMLMAGCTRSPQYEISSSLPEEFSESSESSSSPQKRVIATDDPWWRSLGDDQLSVLVEEIFSDNLQLGQARERVIQMRAIAIQAGSSRWPSLSLELGWSRTKQLNPFSRLSSGSAMGGAASSAMPSSFEQDNFRASLAVSYEVDIWGRIGSTTQAAELDALASESDLKAMAITVSASAVDVYLQLIEAQNRLSILEGQLRDDEDALSVTLHRFQQGLSPQIEVLQQTQQRDRTSSQLPPAQAVISILKRRLAALRGEARLSELTIPRALPVLPELPEVGLPATVLEARPDIQAVLARVSAADARVSAAFSARLPGLRIGASGGYQSFELKELFDDFIWSLTGSLITPLFQGGRLKAEQSRAEAQLRERILALKERSLLAYHEIEDALVNERSAVEQLSRVRAQLTSAQSLFESAQRRYLQGVGDFLTMLAARQGLYAGQLAALSAERSALTSRVQLHRTLGGGWVHKLTQSETTNQE